MNNEKQSSFCYLSIHSSYITAMFACQTCVSGFYLGQIELYTHIPVMRMLVDQLRNWDFRVCGVFLLDAQFMIQVRQCKVEL